MEVNKGTLWTKGAGNGTPATIKAPNLLAIPNALVDLLRLQGLAITPHDMLETVNDFIQNSGHSAGQQWECVRMWCVVASQAGANGKSKMLLDTSTVTINDKGFDRWVGNRLDISVGPCPSVSAVALTGTAGNQQGMDYLALSTMLARTIGSNMLQFSQSISPQVGAAGATGGDTALATGKGFDQDQITKLKDACGVCNAQQIPPIWSVIQASKEKSFDAHRAHLAKSIHSWCRLHHIGRNKSTFLKAKFFEDLVALHFNPGRPVAQFHSVVWGMSTLACHLLMAIEAKNCREYEEAAAGTKHTCSLKDLLKRNHSKTVAPVMNYMDLKLNIRTYCCLLWAIFGDHCNYYKELLKIYHVLDREECFTIQNAYTREVCAQITWAIVDNGQSFFGRNPVHQTLHQGQCSISEPRILSVSLIQSVMPSQSNGRCSPANGCPRQQQWCRMEEHLRACPQSNGPHRPRHRAILRP